MKKTRSILVMACAIVISMIITSCGNSQPNEKTDINQEFKNQLIASYLKIKNALVATDAEAASTAAKELTAIVGESQDVLAKEIHLQAKHIAESKNAGSQRVHFNTLSEIIYSLVKTTGTNGEKLYKQHCPMAFENEGAYWLSAEKEINNPYFGDKMLHCGSVKEEL
jgi:hypothetical protein